MSDALRWIAELPAEAAGIAEVPASVAAQLARACDTRQGAAALGGALPAAWAGLAAAWAEEQAARGDLAIAPLLAAIHDAAPARVAAAARARLRTGPLFDALACAPLADAAGDTAPPAVRGRFEALVWEAAARGLTFPELGAWAWGRPRVIETLVLARVDRDLGDRVRAARALAALADGFREDGGGVALAGKVVRAAEILLEHPEPLVWGDAARAVGRLAAHLTAARRLISAWHASPARWRQRRIVAAIASVPAGSAADPWIDRRLDELMSPDARAADPWRLAAVGVAAPHLARERPAWWERLAGEVTRVWSPEAAWSLARGIARLGRRGAGRGLTAADEALIAALREQARAAPPRSTGEAVLAWETEVYLAWAAGRPPPDAMPLEALDERVRAVVDGGVARPAPPLADPLRDLAAALDDPDELVRGRAHARLRSTTRARAARLDDLLAAADGRAAADEAARRGADEALFELVRGRLAHEIGEYGLRATLVGCLADLVEATPPDAGHGRAAARALRAVAESRWVRDVLEPAAAAADRSAAAAVKRFRKPLEDLFDRCVASRPALRDGGLTVAPPLAAWWALCAGRGGGGGAGGAHPPQTQTTPHPTHPPPHAAIVGALRRLEDALRDATLGASAPSWSAAVDDALVALGAGDTSLRLVVGRLASVIAAAEELARTGEDPGVARELLGELAAVMSTYAEVAEDVDAALAPAGQLAEPGLADLGGDLDSAWVMGRGASGTVWSPAEAAPLLVRWERALVPAIREVVVPVARALVELAERPAPRRRGRGARIGAFELVEHLGGGGMGEVWKARRNHQLVALKLPREDVPPDDVRRLAEVLRGEASRLEGMCFAKVATFIEAGVDGDLPYLATAYMRGTTLAAYAIERGGPPIGLPLMKRVVRDVCTGLANLHEVRIVHRDVKPANVFLRFRGTDGAPLPPLEDDPAEQGRRVDEAVLIDLGIAESIGGRRTGAMSLGYVAPEVFDQTAAVGPAADVYALAATIYHAMTRHRFAEGLPLEAAIAWHLVTAPFEDPAVREHAARLPPCVVELLAAATRLDPTRRLALEQLDAAFAAC